MVIYVARCDYNIYEKAYRVEVDVVKDDSEITETYLLVIPENTASTEADFKASVELFIKRAASERSRSIQDWTGVSWRADS